MAAFAGGMTPAHIGLQMSRSAVPVQLLLSFNGPSAVAVANLERAVLDHGGLFYGSEGGGWFALFSPWGRILGVFGQPSRHVEVGLLETPPRCDAEELLRWLRARLEVPEPPPEQRALSISQSGGILTAVRR